MKRLAAALLLLPLLASPLPAPGETLEEIERDLDTLLREIDAMRTELDRLGEIAAVPRATGIRIEIARGGEIPPPATGRVLIDGKAEAEREWTRPEREGFSGGTHPLVVHIPVPPGSYSARIELSHPSWKSPAAADFRIAVKAGEVARHRFRILPAPGKPSPALTPDGRQ